MLLLESCLSQWGQLHARVSSGGSKRARNKPRHVLAASVPCVLLLIFFIRMFWYPALSFRHDLTALMTSQNVCDKLVNDTVSYDRAVKLF